MWILCSLCLVVSFTASAYGQNDVRKPPSITNGPWREVIFRENQDVTLTCKAEGIPAVTYVWKKNGEDLNLNDTHILRGSEGDITINSTTQKDDGFYQCFATNEFGTALSTVAHIQMAYLHKISQSITVNMTVEEGRPFVIPAAQRRSFPAPTYNWEVTTSTVGNYPRTYGQSQRVRSAYNGDLHFAFALKQDELNGDIYKSIVFNPHTDERSGGGYTKVIVTQGSGDPPDFPPNITYFSKSQEVALIGRDIELKCFFSGKPLPAITWSRPRSNFSSERNSSIHNDTTLIISNISKSDEGDYVCTATNTIGTVNQTLNIRVEAVPIFKQESDGPRNVNVTEGDSVTFNCSAFAKPEATVVWLRNGQPIDVNKAPERFVFSNDLKSLTIRDVCRDCVDRESKTDLMVIQCNASNVHGYAFAQGYLNVLLRTKVTMSSNSTFVTVDLAKENLFQFDCSATSDPSTPFTVRWYKVENQSQELVYSEPPYVYVKDGNLTINIGPNCSSTCDKYFGEYRCVGDNGYTRYTVTVILNGSTGSGDPPDFPPNITYFSKSQEVAVIGGNIELECYFSGKPLPNITWSRPRNNFPPGRNNISNFATKLTISNITESDEGDYVCTATNTIGTINHTLSIRVEAAPIFKRESDFPRNVNVTEFESVTFNCSAVAIPEATVVWLWNGQPINVTQAPERFVISNDNTSLTIRDVCRDCVDRESKTDLMVIQCNASNVHGYAFAQGYLNCRQRTKVTLLLSSSFESKENRFQFTCSATSDPSTPVTVQWYKVVDQVQKLVLCDSRNVFAMDSNLTIYTEPNCSTTCDKYLGEYMCVGDNGYTRDNVTVILNGTTGNVTTDNSPLERFVFSNNNKTLMIRDVCRDCVDRENQTDLMDIQCNASNVHGNPFGQPYLDVVKTYCDYERDKEKSISQPCPCNTTGTCSRMCVLGDFWSRPNYNGCFGKEFSELLDKLRLLSCLAHNVEETALKNQTADIASQLSILTNKSEGLSPGNLNASIMMIKQLSDLRSGSNYSANEKEIKSIVQATSNVLQAINSKAWKELENVNKSVATSILFSLDVYGRILSTLSISEHSIEADSLVLEAWSFEKSNLPLQIEFPNRSVCCENRGDRISISMKALDSNISAEGQPTLSMWGLYYQTIHDYLPGNKDIGFVNSRVLAFTIDGLTTNHTLKPPVLITLRHNQEKRIRFQRTCAFWNFDRGDWDSNGCSVNSTNSTHTICSCDHLTNFAILMSRNPSVDEWLSLISIIGCSISVAALILTIIVYAMTWKHSKSSRAAILLNLCVALIIAYIILMAGGDKFNPELYSKVGCQVVAVLLHYFFLAAFFIMLAEGVEMVLYMFFVFHVRRTRETVMLIAAAWVLPLIIVGVSLGSTKLEGYGHETACWLSVETHLIWAFIGPVLCIITVNFVILILVLRLVSQKKDLLAKDRRKRDEIRATIWNLSVTCPVLGLGWLFGVFSIAFDSVIFEYLFVIANSLQGLIIFIIYALFYNKTMNEKISSLYSNYICRCRITYTKMTSTQEQSSSSRATTQTSSTQDQSTHSIAANDSGEAIPMTPAQQQSTSPRAAIQMASAQEKSSGSIAATQMNMAQEQSTISIAATQMTATQELSTSSIAATQMTPTQELSTSSIAATQMTSAQELSTSSVTATQIASDEEKSTISIAATQMTSAQEKSTSSIAATQMASAQDQSTISMAATQMTSAEEKSTSSGAANKKSHKTGFLGVPTAFKFCEMGSQHNLKRTGTQLMSIVDSDTFESTH